VPAVRFVVHGTVQGVGYRWFAFREAQRLGVRGWVTNLPDGTVEVVAGGTPDVLATLEHVLARGPRSAHVTHVEKDDLPHEIKELKSFDIR
jgi:acylphosphatase